MDRGEQRLSRNRHLDNVDHVGHNTSSVDYDYPIYQYMYVVIDATKQHFGHNFPSIAVEYGKALHRLSVSSMETSYCAIHTYKKQPNEDCQ